MGLLAWLMPHHEVDDMIVFLEHKQEIHIALGALSLNIQNLFAQCARWVMFHMTVSYYFRSPWTRAAMRAVFEHKKAYLEYSGQSSRQDQFHFVSTYAWRAYTETSPFLKRDNCDGCIQNS